MKNKIKNNYKINYDWCDNYENDFFKKISNILYQNKSREIKVLEIGGGRSPKFFDEAKLNFSSYYVNDIDQTELDFLDNRFNKVCFDISTSNIEKNLGSEYFNHFDLIISRMVAEHVNDGYRMHKNIYKLLKKDGIAIHLFPKLYATPFVANLLLPEKLAHKILNLIAERDLPKFPAKYSMCRGSENFFLRKFQKIGYKDIELNFYFGSLYFKKIPFFFKISNLINKYLLKKKLTLFSSYLITFLRK